MHKDEKGGSIIEILLAMALLGILLPALLTALVASREAKSQRANRVQAVGLLREMEEAIRVIREDDWDNISSSIVMGNNYYPAISGNTWVLNSGVETVNTYFSRYVIFSNVERDGSGNIVESGGTVDPSTKKATLYVTWELPINGSAESEMYFTRYLNNSTWVQTTDSQFDLGTYNITESITEDDGEVRLTKPPEGTWNDIESYDTFNNTGTGDGNRVFVDGDYTYLVTDDDTTNPDFTILSTSDPSNVIQVGSLNIGYNVNDVHTSGDYAYLASANYLGEFVVVDISDKSNPSVSTTLNLTSDGAVATGVFVDGSYAYVSKEGVRKDAHFVVIDISSPTSPNELDSLSVSDSVSDVHVSGNYAYLATHEKSNEFIVVDISNKSNVRSVDSYNTDGNSTWGTSVFVSGDYAYMTTLNSGLQEFYIFNISTPTAINLSGSYEVGADVYDAYVYGDYAFLATAATNDLIVLNISNKSAPSLHGFLSTNGIAYGVYGDVPYAYIATGDDTAELVVADGSGYYTSGTYESPTFNALDVVGFNYVDVGITTPPNTTLTFQVATSDTDPPSTFVGPDGTSGTSYSNDGAIPYNNVEAQYFRLKFTFSGDSVETPLLRNFTLNYSP